MYILSKKFLLAVSLTVIYMVTVLIINIIFPNSNIRFIWIGISATFFYVIAPKKWFASKE